MHKTKSISLKTVDVDQRIVPLVQWMNSFPNIFTLFSCEGYDEDEDGVCQEPYVLFVNFGGSSELYSFMEELDYYLRRANIFARNIISSDTWQGHLRHRLTLYNVDELDRLVECLPKPAAKKTKLK